MFDFLKEYILEKGFNFLSEKIKKNQIKKQEDFIKNFYNVINSCEYKEFEYELLKRYYGVEFFTNVNGRNYPAFSINYENDDYLAVNNIRDFDSLCLNKNELGVVFKAEEHQKYKKNLYYKDYYKIVGHKIKAPDRPGFLLKEINLNGDLMTGFSARVGTYAENVYSTHALEYEMFNVYQYCKKNNLSIETNFPEIKELLKLRNQIHSDINMDEDYFTEMRKSLLSGITHETLLSVQMIVLMKENDTYNIKIIQRSDDVAISPGKYQIVPAGGFEILNDSSNGYTKAEIMENSSAGCAVFREYLEEIFGKKEFEGHGIGSVNEALMKDEEIICINKLIKEGKAHFGFLGCIVDLILLRHELSFYLVIDDEEYSLRHKFIGNDEIKNHAFIPNVTIDNFDENQDIWEDLLAPGASIWKMFKDSELYKKIKN